MTVCRQCGSANETGTKKCFKCGSALIAPHMAGKIPCVNHANREATTSCAACATRLCDRCAHNLEGIDYCEACAPEGAVPAEKDEDYEKVPVIESSGAERARFAARLLGALCDFAVVCGLSALVLLVFVALNKWSWAFVRQPKSPLFIGFLFAALLVSVAYQVILISMDGRTLGKYIATVIVLRRDGTIAPLSAVLVRGLASVLSGAVFGLGYAWALFDAEGETWHDKLSGTYAFRYRDTT